MCVDALSCYWMQVVKKMHVNITYLPNELEDIKRNGVNLFLAPCGVTGTVSSALSTAALFTTKNAAKAAKLNIDFLTIRGLFKTIDPFGKITAIDITKVRSGDNLQVLKLDGLDPLIAWGTGGRTGHTTIAVWEGSGADRQLWICESTGAYMHTKCYFVIELTVLFLADASPTGAYWPPPYGIIRTPWAKWMNLAQAAGFSVVLLPLANHSSGAFDENKFWKWFETVEGMPYGYHVMLMSFLDTAPNKNLPAPMTDQVVANSYLELDNLVKHDNVSIGSNMYALIIEGINHRLGLNCKGDGALACVSTELVQRNMTYSQATAIPEDDSWRYDADPATGFKGNFSMMCSAFVANSLKVGLSSIWPKLNSHEFTPKDVYQLQIFNNGRTESPRFDNQSCAGGLIEDEAGNGAYCQLLGPWKLPLNEYNTVPVTVHMNEKCAAQWPNYTTDRPC